jgi:hypothetical protein
LREGERILTPKLTRMVVAMRIGCKFHKKESRFSIHYYDKDKLIVIRCLECKPPTEVCRFKIADGDVQ